MTAIEWLLFELSKNGLLPDGIPSDIHNKAKEMEKEKIVNAWDNSTNSGDYRTGKEYYEETFKSE